MVFVEGVTKAAPPAVVNKPVKLEPGVAQAPDDQPVFTKEVITVDSENESTSTQPDNVQGKESGRVTNKRKGSEVEVATSAKRSKGSKGSILKGSPLSHRRGRKAGGKSSFTLPPSMKK